MDYLSFYPNQLDNFILLSSLVFFLSFLIYIILGKIAGRKNTYTEVNRAHTRFAILYVVTSVIMIIVKYNDDYIYSLKVLAVGLFCFFTYHYVFLFQVIGLVKKSVSVNFLSIIKDKNGECTVDDIQKEFGAGKGFSFVKEDRLKQMIHLNFATEKDRVFKITPKGRVVNGLGSLVLKLWGVERL